MTVDNITPLPARSGVPEVSGDHFNAQRFIDEYGGRVRRSPELNRWYIWNGAWWSEDRLERVLDMATDTISGLRAWVAEADGHDEFKRRSRHYDASAKASRRDALLSIVGTKPGVAVAVGDLDQHPLRLACRNGTIDLATGDLAPPERDDLLTRGVDVDYEPDARSEDWDRFVDTTFGGDPELISFVQRLLGYCITGIVADHVLPVFVGPGANGKSTLVGVVQDLLGDHAMTAPEGLVIVQNHVPHEERIAELRGRRLVVSNELEAKAVLAEQTVKMLTGGDTLTGRPVYGRRFNFNPTHKMLLVSNHKPRVRGTDHAIWRRIKVVPFDNVVPPDQQVADLRRQLGADHAPAVLAWLVQGAVLWHLDGLGTAAAVDNATEDYRAAQDVFAAFLSECTVEVERATRTKVGTLFDAWKRWCEASGERPGRQQDFTSSLEDRGFEIETYQRVKSVRGLGILEVGEAS